MKATIIPSKTLLPQYALDPAFYDGVRNAKSNYALVERSVIPPNNGKGFEVKKGQLFRIIQETGPQVVDVALWNIHNPKEFFRPEHSFLIEGWFVRENTRLWSDVPYFRPMATCIEDTVEEPGGLAQPSGIGVSLHFRISGDAVRKKGAKLLPSELPPGHRALWLGRREHTGQLLSFVCRPG